MTRFDPMDMLNLRRRDRDSQARQRCEASSRTRFIPAAIAKMQRPRARARPS